MLSIVHNSLVTFFLSTLCSVSDSDGMPYSEQNVCTIHLILGNCRMQFVLLLHELAITFIVNCRLHLCKIFDCCCTLFVHVLHAPFTNFVQWMFHFFHSLSLCSHVQVYVIQNSNCVYSAVAWCYSIIFYRFQTMSKYIITLKLSIMLQEFRWQQFNSTSIKNIIVVHKSIYLHLHTTHPDKM